VLPQQHGLFSPLVQQQLGVLGIRNASTGPTPIFPVKLRSFRAVTSADGHLYTGLVECSGKTRAQDRLSIVDSGDFLTLRVSCTDASYTSIARRARTTTGAHTFSVAYKKAAIAVLFEGATGIHLTPLRPRSPEAPRLERLWSQAVSRDDFEMAGCINAFATYKRVPGDAFRAVFMNRIYHCGVGLPMKLAHAVLGHQLMANGASTDSSAGIDPQNVLHLTSTAYLAKAGNPLAGTIVGTTIAGADQGAPPSSVYRDHAEIGFYSHPSPAATGLNIGGNNPNGGIIELVYPVSGTGNDDTRQMLVQVTDRPTLPIPPAPFAQPKVGTTAANPCGANWKMPFTMFSSFVTTVSVRKAAGPITKLDGAAFVGVADVPRSQFLNRLQSVPGYGTTTHYEAYVRLVPVKATQQSITCAAMPSNAIPVDIYDFYPAAQAAYNQLGQQKNAELAIAGADGTKGAAVTVSIAGYDAPANWRNDANAYIDLSSSTNLSYFADEAGNPVPTVTAGPGCAATPYEILNFADYYQESTWEKVWSAVADVVGLEFELVAMDLNFFVEIVTTVLSAGQCPLYDPTGPPPASQSSTCTTLHAACQVAVQVALSAVGAPPSGLSAGALVNTAATYVSDDVASVLQPVIAAAAQGAANVATTDGVLNTVIAAALESALGVGAQQLAGVGVDKLTGNLTQKLLDDQGCPDPTAAALFSDPSISPLIPKADEASIKAEETYVAGNAPKGMSEAAYEQNAADAVFAAARSANPALDAELGYYQPGTFSLVRNGISGAECPVLGANPATYGTFDQYRNPRAAVLFLNVALNPSPTASKRDTDLTFTDRSGTFETTTVHVPVAAMLQRGQTSTTVPVVLRPFYGPAIVAGAEAYGPDMGLSPLTFEGWEQELWWERLELIQSQQSGLQTPPNDLAMKQFLKGAAVSGTLDFVITDSYNWTLQATPGELPGLLAIPNTATATLAARAVGSVLGDWNEQDEPHATPLCYPDF